MSDSLVDRIARAVLYEGYILYPYRPSIKNKQRWTFGGIYPPSYSEQQGSSDACSMQSQCLLVDGPGTRLSIRLRFLHLTNRIVQKAPSFEPVESLRFGDEILHSWQEAAEREVVLEIDAIEQMINSGGQRTFSFDGGRNTETVSHDDTVVGRIVREQQTIRGRLQCSAMRIADRLVRLTVSVVNETSELSSPPSSDRDAAIMQSLVSTHFVLAAQGAEFISLTDPPAAMQAAASDCRNAGCWPVLAGECGQKDTVLISPIILPDYPQIAPESPGDLFDGCEIDEILTLRIMTLTDEEKKHAAAVDARGAEMLARTEALALEQMMNLHGAMRETVVRESGHA